MEMTRRKFINTTGVVAKSTRREFLKESLAALGFAVLPGGWLFAAPPGWKQKGMPNLVFGVISDTHLRTAVKGNAVPTGSDLIATVDYHGSGRCPMGFVRLCGLVRGRRERGVCNYLD